MKAEYRYLEAHRNYRRYRCRCVRCGHRVTLKENPRFHTVRRCSVCRRNQWRVDWYRTTHREHRRVMCHCSGRPYPHRRGRSSCEMPCPY